MATSDSRSDRLPLEDWSQFMVPVRADLQQLGRRLIEQGSACGAQAQQVRENWGLDERLLQQESDLSELVGSVHRVLHALNVVLESATPENQLAAAAVIDDELPGIEERYLATRRFAQDLLHWYGRYADEAGGELEQSYRQLMSRLIAYGPQIRPRLEALQENLVSESSRSAKATGSDTLLPSLNRYLGVVDSAHRFIAAVTEPPLELVFEETGEFIEALREIPLEVRAVLASSLNDCCQQLQYHPGGFAVQVREVGISFPGHADSSLYVYANGEYRVFLTVEEDPLFGRLTVHLLRVVRELDERSTEDQVCRLLQNQWN